MTQRIIRMREEKKKCVKEEEKKNITLQRHNATHSNCNEPNEFLPTNEKKGYQPIKKTKTEGI